MNRLVQRLYPKDLAESSWDNTGLLVEACRPTSSTSSAGEKLSVLLTIDLTKSVVDEALDKNTSFIVAYHPFIFRGLKSILPSGDSQQQSLVRLIQAGISVYSPHTAVDAARGGVNDWLADGISGGINNEISPRETVTGTDKVVSGHEDAGMGRIVRFKDPISFNDLVSRVKKHLGIFNVQVAITEKHRSSLDAPSVSTVALCAGSGGSVLRGCSADVHFTGELGHHEALSLIENGTSAIVCGHSNTERGFLYTLQKQLTQELQTDWDGDFEVLVSSADRDPLEIV